MPIYDYKCNSCENEFTQKNSIDERRSPCEKPCEKCGAENSVDIVIRKVGFSDPFRLGLRKPDSEFSSLLNNIKKNNGVS